ncbi:M60 family metallopeptidase [Listeria cornellensis]|uniref:M60 family metallopeptidase n=1 Tax=Listeria cornellensis TaxID=1494961 RepID=UPI0004B4D11A|nr:M60 family metallopeptidase [Listeria cornellensis]
MFVLFQQTVKAEEVQSKELYTLEKPTWLINEGFSKGINHDKQDLGIVLSKGSTLRIRQVNTAFTEKITVQMLNNDSKTEKSVAVGNDWVNITVDADAVPFIMTTFTSAKPKIEYQIIGNSVSLPKFEQSNNEAAFFSKWDANNASFALIGNKYVQILIPTRDKYYLKKMNDFSSIDQLLAYYDNVFETFNELSGISFNPKNSLDKNIPNRYFGKANKSGNGGAYYGGSETAESSESTITFWLTKGWGALHEIGHGYQGNFMNDNTYDVGEVWNNIYADTFQKRTAGSVYFTGAGLYAGGGGVNAVEDAFEKKCIQG